MASHRIAPKLTLAALLLAALTGSASAMNTPAEPVLHSTQNTAAAPAQPVADMRPGETFSIVGACVGEVQSADTLRVVLRLADGGPDASVKSVLATDQAIDGHALTVRVPDVPEANSVFAVKIFRLGNESPQICDAGAIRIGSRAEGKLG